MLSGSRLRAAIVQFCHEYDENETREWEEGATPDLQSSVVRTRSDMCRSGQRLKPRDAGPCNQTDELAPTSVCVDFNYRSLRTVVPI